MQLLGKPLEGILEVKGKEGFPAPLSPWKLRWGMKSPKKTCIGIVGRSLFILSMMAFRADRSRYLHGMKPEVDEHSFFSEASGSSRGLGVDSSMDNSWRLMPSNMPSYALREGSVVQSSYPQLQSLQDYDQVTISSVPKHQHQHSFFGSDFASMEPAKNETRSLRPFFDEWPKTRDSWSDLEEERSNRSAFSTTQLSMSTPMSSLDFDISNRSPSDE